MKFVSSRVHHLFCTMLRSSCTEKFTDSLSERFAITAVGDQPGSHALRLIVNARLNVFSLDCCAIVLYHQAWPVSFTMSTRDLAVILFTLDFAGVRGKTVKKLKGKFQDSS